jgi:hypothetical protein
MHFNTKYIFQGDSEKEIVKKINYNFDQILSFAVGPDGHVGDKGPTGYAGPAGKKGVHGGSGARGSLWFKQSTEPSSSISNQFDKWIDESTSSNEVKEYGPTGSWSYTGYSMFSSTYFKSYSGISGPAGVTDKFVIGFSNSGGLTASETSLVLSDKTLNITNSNPNRSKLIISTLDQTSTPVLTFTKTTTNTTGAPSFYWKNTGADTGLVLKSSGSSISFVSSLGLTIDSSTARSIIFGTSMTMTANNDIKISGLGDFILGTNTTIGTGSAFAILTSNIEMASSYYRSNVPTKINNSQSGVFTLDNTKNVTGTSTSYGIQMEVQSQVNLRGFEFLDLTGSAIFSGKIKGPVSSGKSLQTTFGSTGNAAAGSTGGPYFYHVKRLKEIRSDGSTVTCRQYFNSSTSTTYNIPNVIDLDSLTLWDSNYIMVTPIGTALNSWNPPTTYGVYLKIPAPLSPTAPLFYNGTATNYRVFVNDINPSNSAPNNDIKIVGLVWDYTRYTGTSATTTTYYLTFPRERDMNFYQSYGCSYVDLIWMPLTSSTNATPKIFWKTCNGSAGFINVTNYYTVGQLVPPSSGGGSVGNPLSSSGGGGVSSGGGGIGGGGYGGGSPSGGGGCFLPGTLITMADGSKKLIEEISIGDLVMSYDFNSGKLTDDVVSETFNLVNNNIVEFVLENGTSLRSTSDHPYWVENKGWCSFDPIATKDKYSIDSALIDEDDLLTSDDLKQIKIISIKKLEMLESKVINFHALKNQNYFAEGVLVHNKQIFIPAE